MRDTFRRACVAILGIAVLALGIASCGKSLPTQAGPPPAALGHDETFARAGGGGGGGSGKSTTFSGQATAIRATVLGSNIVLSDAGPLPSAGGAEEASLLRAEVPSLLTARVLHAATIGQGDRSRSERGLGLGLSLVRAIARAHGGEATVESTPGRGSVFRVVLPAAITRL